MKQIPKIQLVNFQVIIVYIKLEIIARAGGSHDVLKRNRTSKTKMI